MFIELDVWNAKTVAFRPTTINTDNIDEFYPTTNRGVRGRTKIWTCGASVWGEETEPIIVKQSYQEVRTLLANVSLLVNE